MVYIQLLKITNDGSCLALDAEVRKQLKEEDAEGNREDIYANVWIKNLYVGTEETYSEGGVPSRYIFKKSYMEGTKNISERLLQPEISNYGIDPITGQIVDTHMHVIDDDGKPTGKTYDSKLTGHLIYVFIETDGAPSEEVCCGCDENPTLGVTMYMGNVYADFMGYIKEMSLGDCSIPKGFIDSLLRFKAMKVSLDSGHYPQGNIYFNKWFSGKGHPNFSTNCRCHA